MRIYRIILKSDKKYKKRLALDMIIEDIKGKIFKYPIFIGTAKQWNKFLADLKEVENA